jgi:hypothetical protein
MISNYAERLMMSKMLSGVGGLLVSLDLRGMFPLPCGVVRLIVVPIPLAIPLEVSHFSKTRECDKRGTDSSSTNVPHPRCTIYDTNSRL